MTEAQIFALVRQTLGEEPLGVQRMTLTHSGNTIYDVRLADRHAMVRLREGDSRAFANTAHNIQALAALGLPVPRVLAADTSQSIYPFSFLILEKLPGRDLLYELPLMTREQMTRLARHIVDVQRAVATLPLGTGFGWGAVGQGGPESVWFDVLQPDDTPLPSDPGGTPLRAFQSRLHQQKLRFQPYFRAVAPVCFLEDLTTKNILLHEGELQGLIDFDQVCFGDSLWMVGLTAGCIVNDIGDRELFYVDELCRSFDVTAEQRAVVTYYAAKRALEFLEAALGEATLEVPRIERLEVAITRWLAELEEA